MSAARIQFDDAIHPVIPNGGVGGVYALRSRSNSGVGRIRAPSLTRTKSLESDVEAESHVVDERDIRTKQV